MGEEIEKDQQAERSTQDPETLGSDRNPRYEKRLITGERRKGFWQRSKDDTTTATDEKGCP
jgi:hypothetical protein